MNVLALDQPVRSAPLGDAMTYADYLLCELLAAHEEKLAHHEQAAASLRRLLHDEILRTA